MISRMVELLSEMIKPAFQTDQTVDFIVGNAKNWGHNTYLILKEHYKASLEARLEELSEMLTQDWKKAFEVAVRWVRRDLPRIPQDVINHAEAVITGPIGAQRGCGISTRACPSGLLGSSPRTHSRTRPKTSPAKNGFLPDPDSP